MAKIIHLDEFLRRQSPLLDEPKARKRTGRRQVRFDENYEIRSPPPGYGTPGFLQADREAAAFMHVWLADLLDRTELAALAIKLSPLAIGIVKWALAELEAARIE
jgi:hypothetical protein